MKHLPANNGIGGLIVAVAGLAIAISMATNTKSVDTVALYSFGHNMPNMDAFDTAFKSAKALTPTQVITKANALLDESCKPHLQVSFSTVVVSPVCQCAYAVIGKYSTVQAMDRPWGNLTAAKKVDAINEAIKACFSTQQLVPQNKFMWEDKYDVNEISSRKVLSRCGLLVLVSLSIVFNLIYCNINFSSYWATASLIGLGVVVCVQLFLPAISGSASNILMMSAILVAPALAVEFLFVDYFFSFIYTYARRVSFIHPYVFFTTVVGLMFMGAIENGVFSWNEFFSRLLSAHALALAYAGVLFFLHYGCGAWEEKPAGFAYNPAKSSTHISEMETHTLAGYFILCLAVGFIAVTQIIPFCPTTPALNFMWFAPWIFAFLAFATPVFAEHLLDGADSERNMLRLAQIAHASWSICLVLLTCVVGYYGVRLWHIGYSDFIVSNMGTVFNTTAYALPVRPDSKGFTRSQLLIMREEELYVLP